MEQVAGFLSGMCGFLLPAGAAVLLGIGIHAIRRAKRGRRAEKAIREAMR